MLEGRKVLEKNDYLHGLEDLFKKYGYDEVYAMDTFTDHKVPGATLCIYNDFNKEAAHSIDKYINYDYDDPEYTTEGVSVCYIMTKINFKKYYPLIYKDGVFYEYVS